MGLNRHSRIAAWIVRSYAGWPDDLVITTVSIAPVADAHTLNAATTTLLWALLIAIFVFSSGRILRSPAVRLASNAETGRVRALGAAGVTGLVSTGLVSTGLVSRGLVSTGFSTGFS